MLDGIYATEFGAAPVEPQRMTSRSGRHGMGRHSGSDGLTGHIAALPPPDGSDAPADLKNTAPAENTAQVKNAAPVKNPAPAGANKTPETRASPAALPAGQPSDPAAGTTYRAPGSDGELVKPIVTDETV